MSRPCCVSLADSLSISCVWFTLVTNNDSSRTGGSATIAHHCCHTSFIVCKYKASHIAWTLWVMMSSARNIIDVKIWAPKLTERTIYRKNGGGIKHYMSHMHWNLYKDAGSNKKSQWKCQWISWKVIILHKFPLWFLRTWMIIQMLVAGLNMRNMYSRLCHEIHIAVQ